MKRFDTGVGRKSLAVNNLNKQLVVRVFGQRHSKWQRAVSVGDTRAPLLLTRAHNEARQTLGPVTRHSLASVIV